MFRSCMIAALQGLRTVPTSEWRWTIFSIAIGAVLLTIGLTACGIYAFRKKTKDRTLLYFGIFVIFYAVRMFMREGPVLAAFEISRSLSDHIERFITFTIALPVLLLLMEMVQLRWRQVMRWTLAVQTAFAVVAIPLDWVGLAARLIDIANSVIVLTSWLLLAILLLFFRRPGRLPAEVRVVLLGLTVFGIAVLHANLNGLHLIPGRNVEPIGFLFFVCTLGYYVAHRIFAREESLLAIRKELEIAEQIQASILPRDVPRVGGIDIAARYLPMSAVAGDFYDFLLAGGQQLGVLIADVTGHGVPAALIASMLKVAFASQSEHAADPARVLTGLNRALCGKFEDHFVTAAYLFFDLERRVVRYAGAGHPPLLSFSAANRTARAIEQNGLFLGMFPEAEYTSMELPLQSGDRYLLYTDGLPETKNATGEEFGTARFAKILESQARLGASALADELFREIARWSAQDGRALPGQEDDMTLVVLDFDHRQLSDSVRNLS